jgi:hypothetical protein
VVVGLVMGLLTAAYAPARTDLERASDLFRSFREQPTPELAQSARAGLATALSPNERLQQLYHHPGLGLRRRPHQGLAPDRNISGHARRPGQGTGKRRHRRQRTDRDQSFSPGVPKNPSRSFSSDFACATCAGARSVAGRLAR